MTPPAAAASGSLLVLNAGSSSLKFALYDAGPLALLGRGQIESLGADPRCTVSDALAPGFAAGPGLPAAARHGDLVPWLLAALGRTGLPPLVAVGHRVVHGGARFTQPAAIDADVLQALQDLVALAPAHQPQALAGIRAIATAWPGLPQIACFDTAFHRSQPRLAQIYALPRALTDQGVLRYGFHGLSYDYIAGVLPDHLGARAEGRVIVAHLGNGASLCAMRGRQSQATTMGYTALDGLMMGTRSGAIDPGLVLHLLASGQYDVASLGTLLYTQSGLLGVSGGLSADVRVLQASPDPAAAQALDLFAYRAVRDIGSLMAALGGLDALVFTAGIGAHSAPMRARICQGLAWAGVALDAAANARGGPEITTPGSPVTALALPTDEEIVIARATSRLLAAPAPPGG